MRCCVYIERLATLGLQPENEEDSTADEGAPLRGSGWAGLGRPMDFGTGFAFKETCDGQTLASPGRWPFELRKYPEGDTWTEVSSRFMSFAQIHRSLVLLTPPALGKYEECPFSSTDIAELKRDIVEILAVRGLHLGRRQRRCPDRLQVC